MVRFFLSNALNRIKFYFDKGKNFHLVVWLNKYALHHLEGKIRIGKLLTYKKLPRNDDALQKFYRNIVQISAYLNRFMPFLTVCGKFDLDLSRSLMESYEENIAHSTYHT